MARHRRRPDFRHQWRTRIGRSRAAEPRDRRVGVAVRRVIVTPTFAAGLGIVIAAVLAYPTSRTIFKYSAPNWGAEHCHPAACVQGNPGAVRQATARPGRRLIPPTPAAQTPQASAQPSPSVSSAPSPGAAPVMSYLTVGEWDGGFEGQITITYPAGVPAHWGLWFRYPASIIDTVVGGRLRMRDDHTAIVTDNGRDGPAPNGNVIQVNFWVTGPAQAPPGCSFDHQACHFT
jgi:hypothetical protein